MRRRRAALSLGLALLASTPGHAETACRQALALGMDVSASVDEREYRLQRHGLANALLAPDVASALLAGAADPVLLLIYEWSGFRSQSLVQPWTPIRSYADLASVSATLRANTARPPENSTALGGAALFAARAFAQVPQCRMKTLDLSGDGKNNDGPTPQMLADDPRLDGVTINGLVIAPAQSDLTAPQPGQGSDLLAHFRTDVIRGPGAFTELAMGVAEFEEAMRRKLLREIDSPVLSNLSQSLRQRPQPNR